MKARRGETIELKTRKVSISQFEITRIELPAVDFKVVCSKGTYIRSLVHDFGKTLNNAAHLQSLRRTKSGDYDVENAFEVMELVNHIRQIKELGDLK
jgi:tRNA pseudouridine55 synthase